MRVAVVQGGPSGEAHVSRASGAGVAQGLLEAGHEVSQFELGPDLVGALCEWRPDVVFPVAHGVQGEDGCLQGLLEIQRLPYVGSGVLASALCADKSVAKQLFARAGLPLAQSRIVQETQVPSDQAELLQQLRQELGTALVVKPNCGGSALGTSRLLAGTDADDFAQALQAAFRVDECALVESFVEGRELTCSVLDGPAGPEALAVTEIHAQRALWYDFESKYAPGGSLHECPAQLSASLTETIKQLSVSAHRVVDARDFSRCDLILTPDDQLVILELNTLPGMTEVSLFPEAAARAGISFSDLVDTLVKTAARRGRRDLPSLAPVMPSH